MGARRVQRTKVRRIAISNRERRMLKWAAETTKRLEIQSLPDWPEGFWGGYGFVDKNRIKEWTTLIKKLERKI